MFIMPLNSALSSSRALKQTSTFTFLSVALNFIVPLSMLTLKPNLFFSTWLSAMDIFAFPYCFWCSVFTCNLLVSNLHLCLWRVSPRKAVWRTEAVYHREDYLCHSHSLSLSSSHEVCQLRRWGRYLPGQQFPLNTKGRPNMRLLCSCREQTWPTNRLVNWNGKK